MNKKITIQDIANIAGVAKSTVSRYLNDGYVSKEKAALLDKVIKETGYKANFFAKRLKTKDSKLIGIVMSRVDSFSAGKLLAGINFVLEKRGYQPLILISELSPKKELDHILQLIQQGVDGIIVQSIGITPKHLKIVKNAEIPIIFTGQSHKDTTYIKVNDEYAGRLMGEYIAKLKHRNVVYLGVSPKDIAVGKERYQGFVEGFNQYSNGGKINFVETDFSFESAYAKGRELMWYNPTAVICSTDNIAFGLLRYLHEHNIKVPQDVSLAGFGGYALGDVVYPSLTSLAFDYKHLGAKTAEKLLLMIQGEKVVSEFDMNMMFFTRESTKKFEYI